MHRPARCSHVIQLPQVWEMKCRVLLPSACHTKKTNSTKTITSHNFSYLGYSYHYHTPRHKPKGTTSNFKRMCLCKRRRKMYQNYSLVKTVQRITNIFIISAMIRPPPTTREGMKSLLKDKQVVDNGNPFSPETKKQTVGQKSPHKRK